MDKNEVLSNLYTLRAGLSVISQENDKVEKADKETREAVKEICSQNFKADADYILSEQSVIDAQTAISEYRTSQKERKKKCKKNNISATVFLIAFAIGFGIFLTLFITNMESCLADNLLNGFLGTLYLALTIGCAIGFMSRLFSFKKYRTYSTEEEKNKQYETYLQNVNTMRGSITTLRERQKALGVPARKNCEQIYKTLQTQFSSTLDPRDWQHLDLVIFYFETRRADTVKEALQLVDREMQTQQIVNTIKQATRQICSTISAGFASVNNNITNCFTCLSDQLASQHNQDIAALQGLTTSVNLNNALKAKANTTSEKLMQDVHDIRHYVCR